MLSEITAIYSSPAIMYPTFGICTETLNDPLQVSRRQITAYNQMYLIKPALNLAKLNTSIGL